KNIREWGKLKPVRALTTAPHLFPRIEVKTEEKIKKQEEGKEESEKMKDLVSFQEFQKLDLRVGKIRKAEAISGSKKLIRLTVDVGEERTVVAGLARHYSEEDLIEKQVVMVVNLEPVKLMGVVSHGMVLAAEDGSGVHLLVPDANTIPGSKVS
ncbi:MAG: methionine--tRNA ligase subunit beta, partial [Desulfatiglandales bacterium]